MATLRLNFPDLPVWHGDIAALSAAQVLTTTGLVPGALDVLDGSPPCQGFSTAGTRHLADPATGSSASSSGSCGDCGHGSGERGPGMVRGRMRLVFADCLTALKESGYAVSARVLEAMYFGAPSTASA